MSTRESPSPGVGTVFSGGVRTYPPLVALTVWQPYAWAISAGLKLVENRSWPPWTVQPGQPLAIHAALRPASIEAVASVRELAVEAGRGLEVPSSWVHGALVAVAVLDRVVHARSDLPEGQRAWWVGPMGWVLRDVRPLEPLPCRGGQGLWHVPGELVHQVWDQLEGRAGR